MGRLRDRAVLCERARGWASLALDGELSEFERALLTAHLDRCPACAGFAAELAGFTAELRAAALEPVPRLIELPVRRRHIGRTIQIGAAAAVVAVAVGIGGVLAEWPAPTAKKPVPSSLFVAMSDTDGETLLRVPQRLALLPLPPRADLSQKFLDIAV
jgi:predicted anti-sigma-YlaC factor YlaD